MTKRSRWRVLAPLAAGVITSVSLLAAPSAGAAARAPSFSFLLPGNLVVSRSVDLGADASGPDFEDALDAAKSTSITL